MLAKRVGGALDYKVRWQPNDYAPESFVERVRPLELMGGMLASPGCPHVTAQAVPERAKAKRQWDVEIQITNTTRDSTAALTNLVTQLTH